jgi:hypothetical protein
MEIKRTAFLGVLRGRERQLGFYQGLKNVAGSIVRKLLDEALMARPESLKQLKLEAVAAYDLLNKSQERAVGIGQGLQCLLDLSQWAERLERLNLEKTRQIGAFKLLAKQAPQRMPVEELLENLAVLNETILSGRITMAVAGFSFESYVDRQFSSDRLTEAVRARLEDKVRELVGQQDVLRGNFQPGQPPGVFGFSFVLRRDVAGLDLGFSSQADNDNSKPDLH